MKAIFPKYCFLRSYLLPILNVAQCHFTLAQVVHMPDCPFPFDYPVSLVKFPNGVSSPFFAATAHFPNGFVVLPNNFGL